MSVTDDTEKKFVMKHVFKDAIYMKDGDTVDGPIENHYGVPWKIRISRRDGHLKTFLDCLLPADNEKWSINTHTSGKTILKIHEIQHSDCAVIYDKSSPNFYYKEHDWSKILGFTNDGDYVFEFTVIIDKAMGLEFMEKLRDFNDESAKEDSDVTLIVKDQKFHVLKKYLSTHSTYFKTLFSENFAESGKTEIELKDIDPKDFQYFMEFLYAESFVETHSVLGILHVADYVDAKTAIKRCQEFLIQKSELPLKQKFETAIKYNLEKLKTKCLSEMKTIDDLRSIVPEDGVKYDHDVWKELFLKSLSLNSK